MEEEIIEIIKGCNNKDYNRAEQEDFVCSGIKTRVWAVDGEDNSLFYWNSSNGQEPKHSVALSRIANELLDGDESGSVDDGWNEIMFEIK